MKLDAKRIIKKAITLTALFCMTTQSTFAALLALAPEPLAVSQVPPKIMLAISKDQQLYKKAYNDYTDLDGDGTIEKTYKHTIEYFGYFDPYKCYEYSNANNRFEPRANTVVVVSAGPPRVIRPGLCTAGSNYWSGNFLNWVSMSRIDAVRKLLYGGMRQTDQQFNPATPAVVPVTVLERSFVPTDAHAWAKHYVSDPANLTEQPAINRLTPFNPPSGTPQQTQSTSPNYTISGTADGACLPEFARPCRNITWDAAPTNIRVGDQIEIQRQSNASQGFYATVVDISNAGRTYAIRVDSSGVYGGAGQTFNNWRIFNYSTGGISFCNMTPGSLVAGNANARSSTNTNAPLIRVALGNYPLWAANERWQCGWFEERSNLQGFFAGGLRSNGNQLIHSQLNASAENPLRTPLAGTVIGGASVGGATGDYVARVKVCDPDPTLFDPLVNGERCKRYPNGNLKPTGLLQEYGDNGRFHFGLMTGSYAKNKSGGVLRKNPGTLADEVRANLDGAFVQPYRPGGGTRTQTSAVSPDGIINTLNYMRIYGYLYTDTDPNNNGSYIGANGDNCTYQLTDLTENACTSWGNPMSEIFFEAVRYFAGRSATAAYAYTANNSKDNELGLPLATVVDPLTSANYCANLNVIAFNAAVADNDDDLQGASTSDIAGTATAGALTDIVGNQEGITNGSYFAGKILGTSVAGDADFELCTAKTVGALSNVSGICPEGPTTGGSFLMAGIANHAKKTRIRADFSPSAPPASDPRSLKVTTYGIQLASNTPQLEIRGNASQRVIIQPIYRLNAAGGGVGGGAIVDMRYVRELNTATLKTGKIYVNWEDSEQGGDYDQDMWGTIDWSLDVAANTITISTNAVAASTGNPQGFGYSVSGTTRDGPHFHSGIYGFNYTDPIPSVLGCTNCNLSGSGGQTGRTSVTYALAAAPAAGTLKDPLWYAAKYGGFTDTNGNSRPDLASEWDKEVNNTGNAGTDGIPDNYFLVTNPLKLVAALNRTFASIAAGSSGTSVSANSTSLSTTNRIFQARYNPPDWSGQLLARVVNPVDRSIDPTPAWEAGARLKTILPGNRVIMTFDDVTSRDGVAFRSGSISANLVTQLNNSPTTLTPDSLGTQRLNWLRGDQTQENNNGGPFRPRIISVLGDIVNSDPTFVGVPNAARIEATYSAFRDTNFSRRPTIYVGANDGMVHGFDVENGNEVLAYIPSKTFPHLNKLTHPGYTHRFFVDGPTEAADAFVNNAWKTVLIGGLGGGGQGLYALDVTNPSAFTEANAANIVLWEFNDTDNADLGYVYGKPVVRQMANGRWAAIVSAGYNNSEGDAATGSGRAALFVIFLDGPSGGGRTWIEGTDYIKIDTGVGEAATPNGLAPPLAADVDGDLKVDFVYAGDIRGNMWKFDVRSTAPGDWSGATKRVILFTARDSNNVAQPITAQAEGTFHPDGTGFIITFGTGKFLEINDPLGPYTPQSFYGIWDKNDGGTSISGQTVIANRSSLLQQTITASGTARILTTGVPDWTSQAGWFMDFPSSATTGERSVFRPLLMSSRLIFTTLIPLNEACRGGGTSFLMIVDPFTGGRVDTTVFDLNGDGLLNDSDQVGGENPSGSESPVGITPTPVVVKGGAVGAGASSAQNSKIYGANAPYLAGVGSLFAYTFLGGPLGITGMAIGLSATAGRVSWREIIVQ